MNRCEELNTHTRSLASKRFYMYQHSEKKTINGKCIGYCKKSLNKTASLSLQDILSCCNCIGTITSYKCYSPIHLYKKESKLFLYIMIWG